MKKDITDVSPLTMDPKHAGVLIAVVIASLALFVTCVFQFGLITALVASALYAVFIAPAIIRARHKQMTREEYQAQCQHYFIGDHCRECGYCYNDKK